MGGKHILDDVICLPRLESYVFNLLSQFFYTIGVFQNEIAANVTVSSADSTTKSNNVIEKSNPVTPAPVQATPPPQGSSKRKHASGPPTTIQTTPHANSNSKTSNSGLGRRRPIKPSPPVPNRNLSRPVLPAKKSSPKKSKKEKIMCICRTPYDSSQ